MELVLVFFVLVDRVVALDFMELVVESLEEVLLLTDDVLLTDEVLFADDVLLTDEVVLTDEVDLTDEVLLTLDEEEDLIEDVGVEVGLLDEVLDGTDDVDLIELEVLVGPTATKRDELALLMEELEVLVGRIATDRKVVVALDEVLDGFTEELVEVLLDDVDLTPPNM